MARVRGPYSAAFPVNFTSKGDTTRDAFKKHMDEISRIYGILTDFDKDVANTEGITGELTKHINSANPHPNYKPSISWSDLTGKPGLDDLSGTLSASKVKGELTNATIASGKVTGLESFVKGLLPNGSSSDKGDGITSSNLSANGYVKFNNGLIIQWGNTRIDTKNASTVDITFPTAFTLTCYSVIPILNTSYDSVFCTLSGFPTASNFRIHVSRDTSVNMIGTYIHYLAIGV